MLLFLLSLSTVPPQTPLTLIFVTPPVYLSRFCVAKGPHLGPKSGPKPAKGAHHRHPVERRSPQKPRFRTRGAHFSDFAFFCPPFRNHLRSFSAVFTHNASPDPSNLDFRHTCRLFVVVLLGQGCQFGPQRWPQVGPKGFAIAPPFHTGAPSNHDFAQERPIRENNDLDRLKSKTVNNFLNLFRSDGGNDGVRFSVWLIYMCIYIYIFFF